MRQFGFSGQHLQQARRWLGISQGELSKHVQVHRSTVVRWEAGSSFPTRQQVQHLAEVLGKSPEYFFGLSGDEEALELRLDRIFMRLGQLAGAVEALSLSREAV